MWSRINKKNEMPKCIILLGKNVVEAGAKLCDAHVKITRENRKSED